MQLRLVIVEGPRKGEEFLVKADITIGRSKGDLQLKDSRVSNFHAKIIQNATGEFELEDLGSANGTSVNGQKITKVVIKESDEITLGKTKLRVERQSPPKAQPEFEKGSWQERIDLAFAEAAKLDSPPFPGENLRSFAQPITLEIVQGIQTGTHFLYGFGPRKVGSHCIDGLLCDTSAPAVAFELIPGADGSCEFKAYSDEVLLNGSHVDFQKLKNDDRISIGQTVIVAKNVEIT